jgi:hypothetical protein
MLVKCRCTPEAAWAGMEPFYKSDGKGARKRADGYQTFDELAVHLISSPRVSHWLAIQAMSKVFHIALQNHAVLLTADLPPAVARIPQICKVTTHKRRKSVAAFNLRFDR